MIVRDFEILCRRIGFGGLDRLDDYIVRQMIFLCRIFRDCLNGVIGFWLREPFHQTGKVFTALSPENGVRKRRITELNIEHSDVLDEERFAVFQIDSIADFIQERRLCFLYSGFCRGFFAFIPFRVKDALDGFVSLRLIKDHTVDPLVRFFP